LTNREDARFAIEAGADYLGFIFAPSRRQVDPATARTIIKTIRRLKSCPEIAGVFVNSTPQEVNRIAEQCELDWVQLSGDETWEYCRKIKYPIIKALHVMVNSTPGNILEEVRRGYQIMKRNRLIYLLDSQVKGTYGGTGQTFNWELVKEVVVTFPVFIAGGLSSENVASLIQEIHPVGVDVSSGVENQEKKDQGKIKEFITIVKSQKGRS
jgi:phosphoribosylanthranilate isomerase